MKTALIIVAFVISSVPALAAGTNCTQQSQSSINENTNRSKTTVAASWLNQSQTKSTNSNQRRNK